MFTTVRACHRITVTCTILSDHENACEQTAPVRKSLQASCHVSSDSLSLCNKRIQPRMTQQAQVCIKSFHKKSNGQHLSELQRDQDCRCEDQRHKENPAGTQGNRSRLLIRRHGCRRCRILLHLRGQGRWSWNGRWRKFWCGRRRWRCKMHLRQ